MKEEIKRCGDCKFSFDYLTESKYGHSGYDGIPTVELCCDKLPMINGKFVRCNKTCDSYKERNIFEKISLFLGKLF